MPRRSGPPGVYLVRGARKYVEGENRDRPLFRAERSIAGEGLSFLPLPGKNQIFRNPKKIRNPALGFSIFDAVRKEAALKAGDPRLIQAGSLGNLILGNLPNEPMKS